MARSMLRLVFASAVVVMLVAASPALAGTRQQILRECQDGSLTGDFTAKEIRDARDNIPTDIDQYSDCRDVLSRALAGLTGGGGAGGGAGGGTGGGGAGGLGGGGTGGSGTGGSAPLLTPTTPQDQQALADAGHSGGGPVDVGGASIVPGATGFAADAARHHLPTELIVVLALLALAALAGLVPLARSRGTALATALPLGRRGAPAQEDPTRVADPASGDPDADPAGRRDRFPSLIRSVLRRRS